MGFLDEHYGILILISLILDCSIDNKSALVQVIIWRQTGDKPLQILTRFMTPWGATRPQWVNTSRPRQDGRHFPDDIFKCIFGNEKFCTLIKISLKFVRKGAINNIPALVQIMAWRRLGDKPLSEPMMVSLLTHICVTRPQWVKSMRQTRLTLSE